MSGNDETKGIWLVAKLECADMSEEVAVDLIRERAVRRDRDRPHSRSIVDVATAAQLGSAPEQGRAAKPGKAATLDRDLQREVAMSHAIGNRSGPSRTTRAPRPKVGLLEQIFGVR